MTKTKEEILIQDGIYNDLVNFRPVYIKNVVDAMDRYAQSQCSQLSAEIELMEIELRHTKTLLSSCESSLEQRDAAKERVKELEGMIEEIMRANVR